MLMRCVIQVRRSFDFGGQHFVLRLFPQFQWETRRAESFTSGKMLVDRLMELGLPAMDPVRCFPEQSVGLDAVWTNIDVPPEKLDGFGRGGSRIVEGDRRAA